MYREGGYRENKPRFGGGGNRGGGGQRGGGGFRSGGGGGPSFAPVKEGEELDVTIEAVAEKGDGIAKVKGFVIFVPNTSAGDNVRIRVKKVLRRVGFGEVIGQAGESKPKEESTSASSEGEESSEEESYSSEDDSEEF